MKRGFDNIEGLGQSQIDEYGAVICIPDVDHGIETYSSMENDFLV